VKKITIQELLKELDKYKFKQFHIHHTWKPSHKDFDGSNHMKLQNGMRNYHMRTNGWSDIAQHLTLFPDGKFATGRPFNISPASIKGWNTGAFAMEMIGNFDKGHDKLKGKQKENLLKLIKYFVEKYGQDSIKFHREGPNVKKTCPGSALNKNELIREAINLDKKADVVIVEDKNEPSIWAKEQWEWVKEKGYLDGTRPLDSITRQEMAVVLYRLKEAKK